MVGLLEYSTTIASPFSFLSPHLVLYDVESMMVVLCPIGHALIETDDVHCESILDVSANSDGFCEGNEGGNVSSNRSEMYIPTTATAVTAREIRSRVWAGKTENDCHNVLLCMLSPTGGCFGGFVIVTLQ